MSPRPPCPASAAVWWQPGSAPVPWPTQVPRRRCVRHRRFSVRGARPPARLGILEKGLHQRQWWVGTTLLPDLFAPVALYSAKLSIENRGAEPFDSVILTPLAQRWWMLCLSVKRLEWQPFPSQRSHKHLLWQISFWSMALPWWLCGSSLHLSRIRQLHPRTWMRISQRWGGAETGRSRKQQ